MSRYHVHHCIMAMWALCFLPRVTSRSSIFSWGGFGQDGQARDLVGVNADSQEWMDGVAASNASGIFSIPGYDVSEAWPGSSMDGWTITITALDLSSQREDPLIGYDIKVAAPDTLFTESNDPDDGGASIVKANEDWVFCGWHLSTPPSGNETGSFLKGSDSETRPDGSCTGMLSNDCIDALEKQAKTAYNNTGSRRDLWGWAGSTRYSCNTLDIPDSCGELIVRHKSINAGGEALGQWGGSGENITVKYLNGSTTWSDGWKLDAQLMSRKRDLWRRLTVDYQPVMTLFGRTKQEKDAVEPGFAKLSCIRAATTSDGDGQSSSGSTDDESTGLSLSATSVVQLVGLSIVTICVRRAIM